MRCFETLRCIVIADDNHHIHRRSSGGKASERAIEQCLRFGGGMLAVEISPATREMSISLLNNLYKLFEHGDIQNRAGNREVYDQGTNRCMKHAQYNTFGVLNC